MDIDVYILKALNYLFLHAYCQYLKYLDNFLRLFITTKLKKYFV